MCLHLPILQKLICQTCNCTVQPHVLEIRCSFTCSSLLAACHAFTSQGKFRIHIVQRLHRILFRSRSSAKWNILMMIERTNCQLLVTTQIHSHLCYVISKCSQSKSGWLYYIKDAWEIKKPIHIYIEFWWSFIKKVFCVKAIQIGAEILVPFQIIKDV